MHIWRTCPNCRQSIDLNSALGLSAWSKWAPRNCGIRCPNCKVILAARQRPGFAVFWVVLAVVFAVILLGQRAGRLSRTGVGFLEMGLVVLALVARWWKVRSLIQLSLPPRGVELREVMPSKREYAYLEGKDRRDRTFQPDPSAGEDRGPEWTCPNCNQPNPAFFDLCWNCNHGRPVAR